MKTEMDESLMKIRKSILDYNNNPVVKKLKQEYSRPSFFEMLSKDRSETVHSAFIRWMLQGDDFAVSSQYSPIMLFLDLLIRRDDNQHGSEAKLIDVQFSNNILTRSVSLTNLHVITEYPVKKLAESKLHQITDKDEKEIFEEIVNKVQDRIDIYLECDIEDNENFNKLQIIIENKVESVEGTPKKTYKGVDNYSKLSQTQRYYFAANISKNSEENSNENKQVLQLFVYLTPLSTMELDNFTELDDALKCTEVNNYIQINYQDILDYIIIPLLNSDNLSDRVRVLLNEYKKALTIPSVIEEDEKGEKDIQKLLVMASQENERKAISDYLRNNADLIKQSICMANRNIILADSEKSFCQEKMEAVISKKEDEVKRKYEKKDYTKKRIRIGRKNKTFEEVCRDLNASDVLLLLDFYKQNYRLMIAALKILVDSKPQNDDNISSDEFAIWQEIYTQLSSGSQDLSKYNLYIEGKQIGINLSKRNVVRQLVQHIKLDDDTTKIMNDEIVKKMFLLGKKKPSDFTRYDGLKNKATNQDAQDKDVSPKYELVPLNKDNLNDNYVYFVSNQWGVLPLPDFKKRKKGKYPSGWGGNFGKFLDFFEKNQNYYNVKIERVGDKTNSSDNTSPDNTVTEER